MPKRHLALIVEDRLFAVEDIKEALKALGCDSVAYTNKAEALEALRTTQFCVVVLDLGILGTPHGAPDSKHGHALLAELRKLYPERTKGCFRLPVVINSGTSWDFREAVGIMLAGADDIVALTAYSTRGLSTCVRDVLERSGRSSHAACAALAKEATAKAGQRVPASPAGRGASRAPKVSTGITAEDIARLAEELKPVLDMLKGLIDKTWGGVYKVSPEVISTQINYEALLALDDFDTSYWVRQIEEARPPRKAPAKR